MLKINNIIQSQAAFQLIGLHDENASKGFNAFVQNCIADKMIDMGKKAAIKEEKQIF